MSNRDGVGLFFVGLVVGALSGATAALLLAPQSGAETRTMIKDKSIELRDKAQVTADQAKAKTDDLIRQLRAPTPVVLTVILELELAGRCLRHPGNRVSWR